MVVYNYNRVMKTLQAPNLELRKVLGSGSFGKFH